jgi:hypothetical protein
MVSIVLDSASWRCVEVVPPISFSLEGRTSVRRARRSSIAVVEGLAAELSDGALVIDDGDELRLRYTLPAFFDLRPLLGRRIRVTLRSTPLAAGPTEQLLTIADHAGRTWMIAHFGPLEGETHVVGETRLVAALSQRPGGPMVFGTKELQSIVHIGEHVAVHDGQHELVMHFVARTPLGYAAYAIVDRALYRG